MIDRNKVENLVREKLLQALKSEEKSTNKALDFLNEKIVYEHKDYSVILITPNAVVTPSARDAADELGIRLEISMPKPVSFEQDYNPQTVVIGSDHGGFALKEEIKKELTKWGYPVMDIGTHNTEAVDYPDFAYTVATTVACGKCKRGIMIDGAGIGSCMVANKIKGVRAANCYDLFGIKNSRQHNDANVLTLGGRTLGPALAIEMVKVWLETPFEGGRHKQRVDKIMRLELS